MASSEAMERANPVFNTAKMTLFWLARAGVPEAKEYFEKFGFDKVIKTEDIPSFKDVEKANTITQEFRFKSVNRAIREAGNRNVLDLACGYAPRGSILSKEGYKYIGGDLPAAIEEITAVVKDVEYRAVDVTNTHSMEEIGNLFEGELTVITEGLIMYFTESEFSVLCRNIRKLLIRHGGCWINPDPESMGFALGVHKGIVGEDGFMKMMEAKKLYSKKSDTALSGKFMTSKDEAERIFNEAGLKVSKVPFLTDDMQINSYNLFSDEVAGAIRKNMQGISVWVLTADEGHSENRVDDTHRDFNVRITSNEDAMDVKIAGRLDSLNAPELLERFEAVFAPESTKRIRVDLKETDYISSAGLRVLLIMCKRVGTENMKVENANGMVRDIMMQSGFDTIIGI